MANILSGDATNSILLRRASFISRPMRPLRRTLVIQYRGSRAGYRLQTS